METIGKEIKPHRCPYCGKENHKATNPLGSDIIPPPGSLSLCIGCAGISIFNDDLTTRKPTEEEKEEILKDANVQRLIIELKAFLNRNRYAKEN